MKPDREPCLSDARNTNARGEPPAAPDSLSLSLWLQLMKSSKAVEAAVSARFRAEFEQSLARFDVLSQLYRMDGRRGTVGQIAGQVMAAGGNITALIHRMAEDGLVVRSTSPVDRRSSDVTMSPAGLAPVPAHGRRASQLDAGGARADARAGKETARGPAPPVAPDCRRSELGGR